MLSKKFFQALLLIVLTLPVFLIACSVSGVSNKAAADKGKAVLEALKSGNIDNALASYSDKFFVMQSRNSWRDRLENISKEIGQIQTYEIRKLNSDTRYSGKFFIIEYKVVHGNGSTWQTLNMVNPNDTDKVELIGHKIKILGK
jgi:hypothetical protein